MGNICFPGFTVGKNNPNKFFSSSTEDNSLPSRPNKAGNQYVCANKSGKNFFLIESKHLLKISFQNFFHKRVVFFPRECALPFPAFSFSFAFFCLSLLGKIWGCEGCIILQYPFCCCLLAFSFTFAREREKKTWYRAKRKGNNKTPQHSLEERKRKTFIYPSIEFHPFLFSLSRQKAILGTTVISANIEGDGASCNWLHVPSLLSYPIVPFINWKKTLTLISRSVIFGPTPPFFSISGCVGTPLSDEWGFWTAVVISVPPPPPPLSFWSALAISTFRKRKGKRNSRKMQTKVERNGKMREMEKEKGKWPTRERERIPFSFRFWRGFPGDISIHPFPVFPSNPFRSRSKIPFSFFPSQSARIFQKIFALRRISHIFRVGKKWKEKRSFLLCDANAREWLTCCRHRLAWSEKKRSRKKNFFSPWGWK